ncbi:MAG TPA: hypothetical protein IGS52_24565 [Oscillatoriaceae cyanobacterium M33_DOE_052]|uniref:Uncharacterized protein n=1 Tax=Planktothricoides sp. SpSt-374 TaxID=2282167 RepID=A0A7C3ZG69_9CYAN|nr:hypothetical protein [Oscillatoriaceae cyanobacterium M33_DOE_052]
MIRYKDRGDDARENRGNAKPKKCVRKVRGNLNQAEKISGKGLAMTVFDCQMKVEVGCTAQFDDFDKARERKKKIPDMISLVIGSVWCGE